MARGRDFLRLWQLQILTIVLFFVVWIFSPDNLPVVVWKTGLVTLGILLGYLADRLIFHYARPDRVGKEAVPAAMIRRALIIAACVLAVSQGL